MALPRITVFLLHVLNLIADSSDETCSAEGQGCSRNLSYYWPQQKGSPGRGGYSSYVGPKDFEGGPTWHWRDPHNDVIRATPLIDGERSIYLTTVAGRIYKFRSDGELIWETRVNESLPATSSLMNGMLFYVTKLGYVVSLNMESGKEIWRTRVSNMTGMDTPSVLAFEGLVISGTCKDGDQDKFGGSKGNSQVVAVDAVNGKIKWVYNTDIHMYNFQACAPGDGTVVFQDMAGGLYRISLNDGHLIWKSGKSHTDSRFNSTWSTGGAVVHDGKVFVVSNAGGTDPIGDFNGLLHVYNVEDGRMLWERTLPYPANQAVTVGRSANNNRVLVVIGVGSNPGFPVASYLVEHRGWPSQGWPAYFTTAQMHKLSLWMPWLFAPKSGVAMIAFDAATGEQQWRHELEPLQTPAAAGDTENLFERVTGMMSGSNMYNDAYCLPDSCAQPVMTTDGVVYTGWQDGKIYAIHDANHDGIIDSSAEVSKFDFGVGFQSSIGIADGMMAVAPCGGGLYVYSF